MFLHNILRVDITVSHFAEIPENDPVIIIIRHSIDAQGKFFLRTGSNIVYNQRRRKSERRTVCPVVLKAQPQRPESAHGQPADHDVFPLPGQMIGFFNVIRQFFCHKGFVSVPGSLSVQIKTVFAGGHNDGNIVFSGNLHRVAPHNPVHRISRKSVQKIQGFHRSLIMRIVFFKFLGRIVRQINMKCHDPR